MKNIYNSRFGLLCFLAFVNLYSVMGQQVTYNELSPNPFEGVEMASIAFADVNGNGHQDVLVTGYTASSRIAKLYINDGSGNFTEQPTSLDAVYGGDVAFADVDGDGDMDVLITGFSTSGIIAKLYSNDGNGVFTEVIGTPFEEVWHSSIAFADIDDDNDLDVLITGENSSSESVTKLYINDGNGNFTEDMTNNFVEVSRSSVAFADIDSDGDWDLLITGMEFATAQLYARLYTNDGNGNFTLVSGTPFDDVFESSVAFADVNGNSHQDVIITGEGDSGPISKLYINDGTGSFTLESGTPFINVSFSSVAFADVNNNGSNDLVITGQDENFNPVPSKLYLNDGTGTFTEATNVALTPATESSVAFADVNSDGSIDLMIAGLNNSTRNTILYLQCLNSFSTNIVNACESYTWIDGVNYTSSNNTATWTIPNAAGCDSIISLDLTINPLPVVTANNDTTVCMNASVILNGNGASTYNWGGSISDGTPFNATSTQTYTVTGIDNNNCENTASVTVSVLTPPVQELCVVTVDEINANHNVILWEKPTDIGNIDSFYVYREITFGNYQIIGAVDVNDISLYEDFGANPNASAYKYKIAVLDTCGNIGDLSLYHNSIHLQYLGLGNFQWTYYQIENTANQVASYNVYRDDVADGNWQILPNGVVSGSQQTFTDVDYASFPNALYRVDVNWVGNNDCTATKANINTSRSNKKGQVAGVDGIGELLSNLINLSPVPTQEILNIKVPVTMLQNNLILRDGMGKMIAQQVITDETTNINVSDLSTGVYFIQIPTEKGMVTKKFVKK